MSSPCGTTEGVWWVVPESGETIVLKVVFYARLGGGLGAIRTMFFDVFDMVTTIIRNPPKIIIWTNLSFPPKIIVGTTISAAHALYPIGGCPGATRSCSRSPVRCLLEHPGERVRYGAGTPVCIQCVLLEYVQVYVQVWWLHDSNAPHYGASIIVPAL